MSSLYELLKRFRVNDEKEDLNLKSLCTSFEKSLRSLLRTPQLVGFEMHTVRINSSGCTCYTTAAGLEAFREKELNIRSKRLEKDAAAERDKPLNVSLNMM